MKNKNPKNNMSLRVCFLLILRSNLSNLKNTFIMLLTFVLGISFLFAIPAYPQKDTQESTKNSKSNIGEVFKKYQTFLLKQEIKGIIDTNHNEFKAFLTEISKGKNAVESFVKAYLDNESIDWLNELKKRYQEGENIDANVFAKANLPLAIYHINDFASLRLEHYLEICKAYIGLSNLTDDNVFYFFSVGAKIGEEYFYEEDFKDLVSAYFRNIKEPKLPERLGAYWEEIYKIVNLRNELEKIQNKDPKYFAPKSLRQLEDYFGGAVKAFDELKGSVRL